MLVHCRHMYELMCKAIPTLSIQDAIIWAPIIHPPLQAGCISAHVTSLGRRFRLDTRLVLIMRLTT